MSVTGFEIEIQVELELEQELEQELEGSIVDWLVGGVETAVSATLAQQAVTPPVALSLLLTDDAALQNLNYRFRQENKPTDVLSFPAGDPGPGPVEPVRYLGDIAISIPYAQRQARQQGHSLLAELQLLAIHGTLHLLGYDHTDAAEKKEMWAAQTAVLTQLGQQHVTPTEE